MSGTDALRQWHELQVSQLELEVQSAALAELERQKREVEQGLLRYAGLFDQAPVCYLALARDGMIAGANRAAAALFSMPLRDLPGQPVERFLAPACQPGLRHLLAALHADGASATHDDQAPLGRRPGNHRPRPGHRRKRPERRRRDRPRTRHEGMPPRHPRYPARIHQLHRRCKPRCPVRTDARTA